MKASPDDERTIIEAILALEPAETERTLRSEGIEAIEKALRCSDEQAATVLKDLEKRGLVRIDLVTLAGPGIDERKDIPRTRLKCISRRRRK